MLPIITQQRFVQEAKNAMQHYQVEKIYWRCKRFYTPAGDYRISQLFLFIGILKRTDI